MTNELNIGQHNSNNVTNENADDKSVVQLKSVPPKQALDLVDKLERHRRISVAAYHRAARRGFEGVYELQDWLEAEAEIDGISQQEEGLGQKSF